MADQKLSELTELATTPANDDEVYIRDISEVAAAESKRITITNLLAGAGGCIWTLAEMLTISSATSGTSSTFSAHDLWMVIVNGVTDTGGAVKNPVSVRFNGDTGANYNYKIIDNVTISNTTNTDRFELCEAERHATLARRFLSQFLIAGKGDSKAIAGSFACAKSLGDRLTQNGVWDNAADIVSFTVLATYAITGKAGIYYMDY